MASQAQVKFEHPAKTRAIWALGQRQAFRSCKNSRSNRAPKRGPHGHEVELDIRVQVLPPTSLDVSSLLRSPEALGLGSKIVSWQNIKGLCQRCC